MTRWKRLLLIAVGCVVLLTARGCFLRPANNYPGSYYNKGLNAVWLGIEWVNEPKSSADITALADDLARKQVRYVFAYTTYLKDTGQFNATYAYTQTFTSEMKRAQPGLVMLAWVGVPLKTGWGYADLADVTTRQKITILAADLIKLGFDGIHLNAEVIYAGDQPILLLLDELRQAIGNPPVLSVTVPQGWNAHYTRQVASRVDQLVVMSYDSGITLGAGWLYRQWMRFTVIGMTRAVQSMGVELLFGVPTSEEHTASHDPGVENMANGLQGLIDGLNDHEAIPAAFDGVAIYPHWETDQAEWKLYEQRWLGLP